MLNGEKWFKLLFAWKLTEGSEQAQLGGDRSLSVFTKLWILCRAANPALPMGWRRNQKPERMGLLVNNKTFPSESQEPPSEEESLRSRQTVSGEWWVSLETFSGSRDEWIPEVHFSLIGISLFSLHKRLPGQPKDYLVIRHNPEKFALRGYIFSKAICTLVSSDPLGKVLSSDHLYGCIPEQGLKVNSKSIALHMVLPGERLELSPENPF